MVFLWSLRPTEVHPPRNIHPYNILLMKSRFYMVAAYVMIVYHVTSASLNDF